MNTALAIDLPIPLELAGALLGLPFVIALGYLLWRLPGRRESAAAEQRLHLALTEIRATLEVFDQQITRHQQQGADDAARLREALLERLDAARLAANNDLGAQRLSMIEQHAALRAQITSAMADHRSDFEQRQAQALHRVNDSLRGGLQTLQRQIGDALLRGSTDFNQRLELLTRTTDDRLREIGGQVDRRLAEGFEKTTATFSDVVQRLALIDEAQKKITALSGEVVSLQHILADKRSRGAFGEVQLAALVRNVMPEASFALQYGLPNNRVADCVLFMPPPTGAIAIDAKFPLESYRRMTDFALGEHDRKLAERQFKFDIRKHVRDIAERYIVPNVTADGAVMFIPAEAVFAEIQAHHPEIVDEAHAARVWLVSPTTLWAVLTTASAVLKDAATREQVDVVQQHLGHLAKDFQRFRERLDALARHIEQAHDDVQKVHVSARRIVDRFDRIERVELDLPAANPLEMQNSE